jgi:UDP-N-acetylmuramoyl-tripeptide--D-alanyl-D-alanine ligase
MTALTLTIGWAAEAASGQVALGETARPLGEISIDTRTLTRGDFFVALHGPRHDGHDHVIEALTQGAGGVLVDRTWFDHHGDTVARDLPDATVVTVSDTLTGLQDMARTVRRQSGTKVVAITGSAGKTTTKEAIADVLSVRFDVFRNKGNLNNHIGLPLSLMGLRARPDVAVLELGMNHRGEISTLVAIADPDVRVWTNVGDAHLGFFTSPDAIADAKAEILERAEPSDVLVCNADDERVMSRVVPFPGRTRTFGFSSRADVRAVDVEDLGIAGMRARLVTPAGERPIETQLLGRGNLANALAACAVGLEFDVALDEIVVKIAGVQPAAHRGAVRVVRDVTVIDDSYNSSPAALRRALEVVKSEARPYRKIAVLGEMLELGEHADPLHRECGRAAAASGITLLVTIGGAPAKAMADGALDGGMVAAAVHHFPQSTTAAEFVADAVQPGDLVLVKGSRGIRTDLVVDRLLSEVA